MKRRNWHWWLLLAFLISPPAQAQLFYVGPQLSVNRTGIRYADADYLPANDYAVDRGYGGGPGIALGWGKNKYFSVHAEWVYASHRYTLKRMSERFMQNDLFMTFHQVPILFRFTVGGKKIRGHLNAGPCFSFWRRGRGDFFSYQLANSARGPINYRFIFEEEAQEAVKKQERLGVLG